MIRNPRPVRALTAIAAGLALAVAAASPVAAAVRFEPTPPPVADAWVAAEPVDVDWAGVSMRIPAAWTVDVKREPATGIGSGASLLVAFGPGDSLCLLKVYDADTIETWQDVGVAADDELAISGHRAERFDDMLGTGAPISSAYSIYAGDYVYSLLCMAEQAPVDRWLSIAETVEIPAP